MQAAAPPQKVAPHSLPGSVPAAYAVHVPSEDAPAAAAQAWQGPLHAALQQTPSVQKPEVHWLPALQEVPPANFGVQAPPLQKWPDLHWLSAVQEVMQLEAPLQKVSPHSLPGSVLPAKVVQVPFCVPPAETVQAWHAPSHAALQQTPSAQKPDTHSLPPPQPVPCARFGAQVPPSQKFPGLQSVSAAHAARQAAVLPSQKVAPQSPAGSALPCTGVQVPSSAPPAPVLQASHAPSQARSQQRPSAQKPLVHW
jgi:hypothetical protein